MKYAVLQRHSHNTLLNNEVRRLGYSDAGITMAHAVHHALGAVRKVGLQPSLEQRPDFPGNARYRAEGANGTGLLAASKMCSISGSVTKGIMGATQAWTPASVRARIARG